MAMNNAARHLAAWSLLLTIDNAFAANTTNQPNPNILFIFADDLGYGANRTYFASLRSVPRCTVGRDDMEYPGPQYAFQCM